MKLPFLEPEDPRPYEGFVNDEPRLEALKSRDKRMIFTTLIRHVAWVVVVVAGYYVQQQV